MKKMIAVLSVSVAGAMATPAMAQEATPFAGAHVGVEAGWGRVGGGSRIAGDGFVYGATLGYDLARGNLRVGPEVEIADSTQSVCRADAAAGAGARLCERADRDLYVGGRLGYVVNPKVLVYGKFGYSNGRFSTRLEGVSTGNVDRAIDRDGYRLGVGAEYAITRAVYLSGEYRYSHYSADVHRNQILAGVGLPF